MMRKLIATFFAFVTGAAPALANDALAGVEPVRKQSAKAVTEKVQGDFKTAVRENDIAALTAMLSTKRIALSDQVGSGRGLLQFAVMADAVKSARFLVSAGADSASNDAMGSSAMSLAKKRGNQAMLRVLEGGVEPSARA